MASPQQNLTADELASKVELRLAGKTAEIAEGVFKKLFETKAKEFEGLDGKVSKIIYGGIIATILVIIALCYSTWLFMSSYQQNFLDSQNTFHKQINDLRKENSDMQLRFENNMKSVQEKQNYFERLLDRL